jgi:hypothetical protein
VSLAKLGDDGIISSEEFDAKKAELHPRNSMPRKPNCSAGFNVLFLVPA